MKSGVFITGTDTGVGKTVVSSLLVTALLRSQFRAGYFKPVQTGDELDRDRVAELTGVSVQQFPIPVYQFPEPTAPLRAAQAHHQTLELDRIQEAWKNLAPGSWVVEGAGGLLTPLHPRATIRELAQVLNLSLLLVASTRLGTINHTLLTLEAAKSLNLSVAGIVLVGPEDPGLEGVLGLYSEVPVIGRVPVIESWDLETLRGIAAKVFPLELLRSWYA